MCLHFVSGDCGGTQCRDLGGTKCEEGYGAGYVCKCLEKTKSEKRLTREGPLLFHLKIVPFLALHWYFK